MQVERYIHAFHKQTGRLAFSVQLPSDALTFLSTLDFLMVNNDDVDLHCVYDLTKEQVELIIKHFDLHFKVETNCFDYELDCNTVPESKMKTKEEFVNSHLWWIIDQQLRYLTDYESSTSFKEGLQQSCYELYLQGVLDSNEN